MRPTADACSSPLQQSRFSPNCPPSSTLMYSSGLVDDAMRHTGRSHWLAIALASSLRDFPGSDRTIS